MDEDLLDDLDGADEGTRLCDECDDLYSAHESGCSVHCPSCAGEEDGCQSCRPLLFRLFGWKDYASSHRQEERLLRARQTPW